MDSVGKFRFWMGNEYFDNETKAELKMIENDSKEIEERFYKELEFGTGGLRGIIGAGTNMMNIYTVRKASQGLANYVLKQGKEKEKRSIAIAYDCRHMSREFALEAACVFSQNGIKAYLFDELRPTPELSFAVRHLNASAGVVVTASHNTKEYNGYKVYGEDGAQISPKVSEAVLNEMNRIKDITKISPMDKQEAMDKGLIEFIGKEIDDEYIARLKTLCVNTGVIKRAADSLKIVYTPIHGTGNKLVRRILAETGFKNVLTVSEQENPDPDFSTVKSPNPENRDALERAIELAKKENADIAIGTDPDCDRLGMAVRDTQDDYVVLTGNQVGCLMMEYVLSQKKEMGELPKNGFVIKTIVSTELARRIAENFNIALVETFTGFKFICEKIKELDEFGNMKFLFGFEESYGYLMGTFVRDKDGVVASMLAAEMAAYYKSRGMSVCEGLQELYRKYGYSREEVTSFILEGKEGLEKIGQAMSELRKARPSRFGAHEVAAVRDYLVGERCNMDAMKIEPLPLSESNVLYYEMKDGSWFCIRPSGTEPKIKIYIEVSDKTTDAAENKLKNLKKDVMEVVGRLLGA